MSIKTFRLPALAVALTFMTACGSSESTETDTTAPSGDLEVETVEVEDDVEMETMDYMLPSPLQIALIFNHAGLEFQNELPNDHKNVTQYVGRTSKLLNFGAYSADLSYCVVNDESQASLNYMTTVKGLSNDLGLSSVFNSEEMLQKFERNLSNKDTLVEILTELQEKLDEYVDDNDDRFMHVVIFTGAWVESMYLGYRSTDDPNIGRKLMEQMTILDNIVTGLSKNPQNDEFINGMVVELKEAKSIYMNFEAIKNLADTDDADFAVLEVSPEELKALGDKMEQIRNSFVQV